MKLQKKEHFVRAETVLQPLQPGISLHVGSTLTTETDPSLISTGNADKIQKRKEDKLNIFFSSKETLSRNKFEKQTNHSWFH